MGGCAGCGAALAAGGVRERNKSPRSGDLEPVRGPTSKLVEGGLPSRDTRTNGPSPMRRQREFQ
jgi:hypothetical protein